MKNKVLAFLVTIITLSFVLVSCGAEEKTSEPLVNATPTDSSFNGGIQEEIEIVNEPRELNFTKGELERIREKESEAFNESVDLYITISERTQSCGYALTPPEIYRLKQNATAEQLEVIALYEKVQDSSFRIVGSPYDTTWRRLYDSEIEMLTEQTESGYNPFDDHNPFAYFNMKAAEAESQNGFWYSFWQQTLYFDYYAYYDEMAGSPEREYWFLY